MSKKIEMIGRKFHRLTVLKEAERARNGKAMWFCSCECGNKVVVRGDHLRGGRIKSCGCSGSNAYARMRYGWESENLGDPLCFTRKKVLRGESL